MANESLVGRMQGGHILAKAMALKGITKVFSLCGGFLNPIYDGCLDCGIEIIGARHEMEAGFMANAWARLHREPAVVIAEPSGFTNYISAVAEAYYSGDPVIYISSASNSHRLDRWGFKEMPQHEVVQCMTKYSVMVNEGNRIHEFFDKAWDIAANKPTGPVELSIPINFLFSHYELIAEKEKRYFDLARKVIHSPSLHPDDSARMVDILKEARKPVIIAGSGIWQSHAEKDLEDFCARLKIPFFTANHLEIRGNDFTHPYNMGLADIHQNPASRLIHQEADVVLCIGCRLDYCLDFGEPPLFNPESTLVAVNPSARELSDNHIANVVILADSRLFLQDMIQKASGGKINRSWSEKVKNKRREINKDLLEIAGDGELPIHPLRAAVEVLNFLGEDDYLVVDGGDAHGWQETALNLTSMNGRKVRAILMSGPFAQLGVGVSFATAAKMAAPESKVALISGDGSFGLGPGLPMETAIHRGLPIVAVVFNNQAWGMIRHQQRSIWNRTCATDLRDVPFHKMVESLGGYGELVERPEDLSSALERAFSCGRPALLNVRTRDVISQITVGLVDRREKSSLE